jgi:hypothetical protein
VAAFIEVMIEGNARVFLRTSAIMGVATPAGFSGDSHASPEEPLSIILGGGNTLAGVYGTSANLLLLRAAAVELVAKQKNLPVAVGHIADQDEHLGTIAEYISRMQAAAGGYDG